MNESCSGVTVHEPPLKAVDPALLLARPPRTSLSVSEREELDFSTARFSLGCGGAAVGYHIDSYPEQSDVRLIELPTHHDNWPSVDNTPNVR